MLLTFCDTVLPVTIETRPTMAAVPVAVIPAVSESRAFVSVVGTRLRIVHKYCENNERTSQLTRLPKKNLNKYARLFQIFKQDLPFTLRSSSSSTTTIWGWWGREWGGTGWTGSGLVYRGSTGTGSGYLGSPGEYPGSVFSGMVYLGCKGSETGYPVLVWSGYLGSDGSGYLGVALSGLAYVGVTVSDSGYSGSA